MRTFAALLGALVACTAAPEDQRPVAGIVPIESPAGANSGEPNLAVDVKGRVYLSWLERKADSTVALWPFVGVVIHPHRHTADMIRFSEEFAINIPGPTLLKQTHFLGTLSGLNANKLEAAGLDTFAAQRIDAPLIEGCLAWIECGLQDVIAVGDHTLFAARVIKVQALDEAYAQVGRKARIRGFRPGKAPRKLLEQYFGRTVTQDVGSRLIRESLVLAIEQRKLRPVEIIS